MERLKKKAKEIYLTKDKRENTFKTLNVLHFVQ